MFSTFRHDADTALVQTEQGPVQGYACDGLLVFKGIPYAAAKRFHAPEAPEPRQGIFDASNYGYVCPLLTNDRPRGELKVPHRFWPMDEDCLNLNIWTPAADGAKRPVLVWLHGGGYEAGSSIEQIAYDGAGLSRCGDAVVISINHRLNILGYFDLSDFGEEYANSGNAGGDDIIAALRWIHDNIAAFGGDPDRVTVFGQSGGGAKVTTLLQSPAADGLFAGGVVMSGVIGPVLADAAGSGKELAEAMMTELGLKSVKEMETADYRLLARAYLKLRPAFRAAGKYTGGAPHPNAFYLGDPLKVGFRPETAKIPLLVGSVFGEFASFAPPPIDRQSPEKEQEKVLRKLLGDSEADVLLPLFRRAYPERPLSDVLRLDFIFRAPEIDYLEKRSALNSCTWSYLFNMDQPIDGGCTPWHCSDIPYFFNNIDLVEYPNGPQKDPDLSRKVQSQAFGALLAFARSGNPACAALPAWPACRPGKETPMLLDAASRAAENFDHDLMREAVRILPPVLERMMRESNAQIQH